MATQHKEYLKYHAGLFSMILNDKRIARLERLGFEWSQPHFAWLERAVFGTVMTMDHSLIDGECPVHNVLQRALIMRTTATGEWYAARKRNDDSEDT